MVRPILVVALAILTLLAGCGPLGEPTNEAGSGASLLPEDRLELPAFGIAEYRRLLGELRGTPVVVNVWGSWCPPCRVEAPALSEVAREFEGDVQFVGVNILDERESARAFILEFDWPYPSVFDPNGEIRNRLGYLGQPITIIYDREGKVVFEWAGTTTGNLLREEIEKVLAQASPAAQPLAGELIDVLPQDGIPSIDQPRFIPPGEATWLSAREPVVAVDIGSEARAYPVQIMTRHEIVNDVVGGRPVAVTYCPLCNSPIAWERTVGGRVLEFGVSGKLFRSALVMYDRQTESLWTHFQGVAFGGPLAGKRLEPVPAQMLSFDEWRRTFPDGLVLSRDTGFDVEYGENPYVGYDRRDAPYDSFFPETVDGRLPAMNRVVGVPLGGGAIAYPYRDLVDDDLGVSVLTDRTRGVVIFWRAGTASALDAPRISEGRDVGAAGAFSPVVRDRSLTFSAEGGDIRDVETGSTWTLSGLARSGPLKGERLRPLGHVDTFWFAWEAYYPDTKVFLSVPTPRGG